MHQRAGLARLRDRHRNHRVIRLALVVVFALPACSSRRLPHVHDQASADLGNAHDAMSDLANDAPHDARPSVPLVVWAKRFGETGTDAADVSVDRRGRILLSGWFEGRVSFGGEPLANAGGHDGFVAVYDSAGNHRWSQPYGGSTHEAILGATATSDGGVLAVGLGEHAFLAHISQDGQPRWSQGFEGVRGFPTVAFDTLGNLTIAASFKGTIHLGGKPLTGRPDREESFVARFDTQGNHQWSRLMQPAGEQALALSNMTIDSQGNIYLAGMPRAAGNQKGVLIALDSFGEQRFVKQLSSPISTIALGDDRDIHLFGNTRLNLIDLGGGALVGPGIFWARYDSQGRHRASKTIRAGLRSRVYSAAVDERGNVVFTGAFDGSISFGGKSLRSNGESDVFVASYDSSGGHRFSLSFGGSQQDWGVGIALADAGDIIVAGSFAKKMMIGDTPLESAGSADIFLARLSPIAD
jgi:hypothetical protein